MQSVPLNQQFDIEEIIPANLWILYTMVGSNSSLEVLGVQVIIFCKNLNTMRYILFSENIYKIAALLVTP